VTGRPQREIDAFFGDRGIRLGPPQSTQPPT